ncbi:hypothetical protein SCB49_08658 [unidentified eubacterium SCB49]|nr:hypothetical protein SCB49_08658 [unidentified eubacterium SCB49]
METINTNTLVAESLKTAMSYTAYRALTIEHAANKTSTGANQSEAYVNYTKLGDARMRRLDKTVKISEEIQAVAESVKTNKTWLVISESWCGDAANALPVINKIAALNENIDLKIVLRDENLELMNQFLTNGGMSIPKLIQIENDEVTATWGPRPTVATQMVNDFKEANGGLTPEFKESLQVWYNKDKGQNIASDISALLS